MSNLVSVFILVVIIYAAAIKLFIYATSNERDESKDYYIKW